MMTQAALAPDLDRPVAVASGGTIFPGRSLRIGPLTLATPVILAPMAGVTNAPFRAVCRRFGPGLLYVNEMVMAHALLVGSPKTVRMATFGPGDVPRSLQLYGGDPVTLGEATRRLCGAAGVDHIDLNFGCPAPKVTRRGGGAALPLRRGLLRAILKATVAAAEPYGVPVTIKFRKGLDDRYLTYLDTGRIAEEEGVAAITLHARTATQHYAGQADWEAIAKLKDHVRHIPVLGNGDIWEAEDALRMVQATGCDGVVVGRGCLGRPWLFGRLAEAFAGRPISPPPSLGQASAVMLEHARLLCEHLGESHGIKDFRKHAIWYVTGYAVGPAARRSLAMVGSLAQLEDLVAAMDPSLALLPGGERFARGHTNGPIRVALPDGYLDNLDDETPPDESDVELLSGG